jgi:hypothetical protein
VSASSKLVYGVQVIQQVSLCQEKSSYRHESFSLRLVSSETHFKITHFKPIILITVGVCKEWGKITTHFIKAHEK